MNCDEVNMSVKHIHFKLEKVTNDNAKIYLRDLMQSDYWLNF